jgi:hypothetical protein
MTVTSIELSSRWNNIQVTVDLKTPPASLAYKIVLRSGQREWPVNSNLQQPAGKSTTWSMGGQVKDFDANTVDVIFHPDLKVAMDTVDLTDYWNGEIVVKGVKVVRSGAPVTTQSASPAPSGIAPTNPGAPATQAR